MNTDAKEQKKVSEEVNPRKDNTLKILSESVVLSTGLSKEQFYLKAQISRQQWYNWSWGFEKFPQYIKIRLCDLFGKPFRDFFLQIEGDERK